MKKLTTGWGGIGVTALLAHIALFGAYMTLSSRLSPWWLLVTFGIPFMIGLLVAQSVQDHARKDMPR